MSNKKVVPFFKAPRYLFRKFNIIRQIKALPVKNFADIGCGAGELACTLGKKGYKGVGIDFSDSALEVANSIKKQYAVKNIEFKKGGTEKLKNHDLIICCEVLEHIENDSKLLKQLLPHGKYFIFSVPARMQWFDKFDEKVGHFRRYEKESFIKLLEVNGYKVNKFISYGYPYINITRLIRKLLAKRVKDQDSAEDSTKESGINPIKTPVLQNLNLEPFINLLGYTSLPFNGQDWSEGYLVVCERKIQ